MRRAAWKLAAEDGLGAHETEHMPEAGGVAVEEDLLAVLRVIIPRCDVHEACQHRAALESGQRGLELRATHVDDDSEARAAAGRAGALGRRC